VTDCDIFRVLLSPSELSAHILRANGTRPPAACFSFAKLLEHLVLRFKYCFAEKKNLNLNFGVML
jgi:hypothetical protein